MVLVVFLLIRFSASAAYFFFFCLQDRAYNPDCDKNCPLNVTSCCVESSSEIKNLKQLSNIDALVGLNPAPGPPGPGPKKKEGGDSTEVVVIAASCVLLLATFAACFMRSKQAAKKREALSLQNTATGGDYIPPVSPSVDYSMTV